MKLSFPGTRGEIDARTRLHRMHSCLLVEGRILIDCGADWLGKVEQLRPTAIVLTHAHPDHVGGLKFGAPCPVFATSDTWKLVKRYPISDQNTVFPRQEFSIANCRFQAFTVEHSLIAPAVGYRITKGAVSIFYVPDLVKIHGRHEALSGMVVHRGWRFGLQISRAPTGQDTHRACLSSRTTEMVPRGGSQKYHHHALRFTNREGRFQDARRQS
jgi:phosphoribosyl 1,2-cyclic phosphodiesterase